MSLISETRATKARKRITWSPYLLVMPMGIILIVFFAYPLIQMILTTLVTTAPDGSTQVGVQPFADLFGSDRGREIIFRTLRIAAITTVLTFVLALPVTLWIREAGPRLRGVLIVLMLSPLLTSVVVRTLGWVTILGPHGVLSWPFEAFGLEAPRLLYTETAVIIGLTHVYLGYMVLAMLTSMLQIQNDVIGAAANLGANSWKVLTRIVLPMGLPGIIGGCAIVFPLAASAYVTAALLGGSRNAVLGTEIYRDAMVKIDFASASALGISLFLVIAIAIILLGLMTRLITKRSVS